MKIFPKILLVVAVALYATSCKKIVEGFDEDPNRFTSASSSLNLNAAQVASILVNEGNIVRYGGIWSQSFIGIDRQYISTNNYNTTCSEICQRIICILKTEW